MASSQPAIRVEGLALVSRRLKAIEADAPEKVKALNRQAGETAATAARPLVPVQEGGLLATLRAGGTKRSGYVAAGNARVPYAGAIHYGWPSRGIEAQPFLTDALGSAEPRIVTDYDRGIHELIREVGLGA